jgi:hypothetical protein
MTTWLNNPDSLAKIKYLEDITEYNLKYFTISLKIESEDDNRIIYSFQSVFDDINVTNVLASDHKQFSDITFKNIIDEYNIVNVYITCKKTEYFNKAFQVFSVSFIQPINNLQCTMECSYLE